MGKGGEGQTVAILETLLRKWIICEVWGYASQALSREYHDLLVPLDDSGGCEQNRSKKGESKRNGVL